MDYFSQVKVGAEVAGKIHSGQAHSYVSDKLLAPVLKEAVESNDIPVSEGTRESLKQLINENRLVEASALLSPALIDKYSGALLDVAIAKAAVYEMWDSKNSLQDRVDNKERLPLTTKEIGTWLRARGFTEAVLEDPSTEDQKAMNSEKLRSWRIIQEVKHQVQSGGVKHVQAIRAMLLDAGTKPISEQKGTIYDAVSSNVTSLLANILYKIQNDKELQPLYERELTRITRVMTKAILVESFFTIAPYAPAALLTAMALRVMWKQGNHSIDKHTRLA